MHKLFSSHDKHHAGALYMCIHIYMILFNLISFYKHLLSTSDVPGSTPGIGDMVI